MSNFSASQSGKSGGDAVGSTSAGGNASGGYGSGTGTASVWNADPIGIGKGFGGNASSDVSAVGAAGGDVSDNTSIGSIRINS